jgi:nitrogen fixation NifU-like protein
MSQPPLSPALARLYQDTILEHNARPRNCGELPDATHEASAHNPLCGDQVTLRLRLDGERITAARFVGDGCALSRASASLLTLRVAGSKEGEDGLSREAALSLAAALRRSVSPEYRGEDDEELGELAALGGVRSVPSRRRCATLPWEALEAALTRDRTR